MRFILRILIIAVFFVLVFIPRSVVGVLNYWLLFLVLFLLAALYLYFEFWITKRQISKKLNTEDFFSIGCSLVPKEAEDSFQYGRLVIYNEMVLFYVKQRGKVNLKWTREVSSFTTLNFQKLSNNKKGFVLSNETEDYEFSAKVKKETQAEFIKKMNMEI